MPECAPLVPLLLLLTVSESWSHPSPLKSLLRAKALARRNMTAPRPHHGNWTHSIQWTPHHPDWNTTTVGAIPPLHGAPPGPYPPAPALSITTIDLITHSLDPVLDFISELITGLHEQFAYHPEMHKHKNGPHKIPNFI